MVVRFQGLVRLVERSRVSFFLDFIGIFRCLSVVHSGGAASKAHNSFSWFDQLNV